jgi:hypothetical protein
MVEQVTSRSPDALAESVERAPVGRAPVARAQPRRAWTSHAASIALIVLVVAAIFWRVLLLGETLIDVPTLDNQLPWGYYAGESSDYPYNRRDVTDMYLTREYFVIAAYRDGELPLWNPYTMAGHPIYADGVTRAFSPLLLYYAFLDMPLGYSLARITELLLAAIFMYIFLASVGVSPTGSLMGALVFALSGHSLLHLTHLGWWGGLMWLPLILLFVDRAISRASYFHAVVAGVLFGAQFFFSFLPAQIYYPIAIAFYYIFFALYPRTPSEGYAWRSARIRRAIAMIAVTIGIGFALGATQWVPALDLLQYSNRRIVGAALGYIYLPPWYLMTLVFPNLFGSAYDTGTLTLFTALSVSHDHILYLGTAALLPLAFGLYSLKLYPLKRGAQDEPPALESAKRSRAIFFLALAVVALALMMAAPLYVPITKYVPVLRVIRVAVRAWVLFIFAASALVAFGADSLLQSRAEALKRIARLARVALVAAAAFVALGVAVSLLLTATGFAAETADAGRIAFLRKAAAALAPQFLPPNAAIVIPLLIMLAVALLARALASAKISRRAFAVAIVALLTIDLYWNGAQFTRSYDRSRVFPRTEVTEFLRSLPPGRVLVVPSGILTNRRAAHQPAGQKIIAPPNTLLAYRIPTVTGKNQQFPAWYQEFVSLIEPQKYPSHVVFEQPRSPYFDLLNVRYVLTHASAPAIEGCELLMSAEGVSLYENKKAAPRAFFASRVIEARDPAAALARLREPGFDPSASVVIVRPERKGEASSIGETVAGGGKASIIEDRRNRVVIETETQADGLLVLSDNYYPGWRAYVDNAPVELLRADYTMRAVEVPAGRHVVSFEFAPSVLRVSTIVSLASAALVAASLVVMLARRRRHSAFQE